MSNEWSFALEPAHLKNVFVAFCPCFKIKMAPRTFRIDVSMANKVEDPEKAVHGRMAGPSLMPTAEDAEVIRPPGRKGNRRFMLEWITEVPKSAKMEYDRRQSRSSLWQQSGVCDSTVIQCREARNTVEVLRHGPIDKLDDRGKGFAERTVMDALETCQVGHNKVFIKDALRSDLNTFMLFVL